MSPSLTAHTKVRKISGTPLAIPVYDSKALSAAGLTRLTNAVLIALLLMSPFAAANEEPIVAVDVGHSLKRPGATSARGISEFAFNQALATPVAGALREHGYVPRLIGVDGNINDLRGRTSRAQGAAFFLSIHHDSVQPRYLDRWMVDGVKRAYSDRFSGFSLFVSRANPDPEQSLDCAVAIGARLREAGFRPSLHHAEPIPGENRPLADTANGVYFFDDLVVLKTAAMPAVLVEAGIIVNRRDELHLQENQARHAIARAIAQGLAACLPPASSANR
jgi:N-acetylmuramoyl-L-alanine amidase